MKVHSLALLSSLCVALSAPGGTVADAGLLDPSFVPKLFNSAEVQVAARAAAGQLLVGGDFDWISGQPADWLARLNANGSVDGTFNPSRPVDVARLLAVAAQADGKVLAGYAYLPKVDPLVSTSGGSRLRAATGFAGAHLIRFNADGTPDTGFQTVTFTLDWPSPGGAVVLSFILPGADGKILVGGGFTSVNGTPLACLARLSSDGTVDGTFVTTVNGAVECALRSGNGTTVIGGQFTKINTVKLAFGLARLKATGELDKTFVPRGKPRSAHVTQIAAGVGTTLLLGTLTETIKNGVVQGIPKCSLEMVGATGTYCRAYASGITGIPVGLASVGTSQAVLLTTSAPLPGVIPLAVPSTALPVAPGYAVFAATTASATARVAAPFSTALVYSPNGMVPTAAGVLGYGLSGTGLHATPTMSGFAVVQRPVVGKPVSMPAGFGGWVGNSANVSVVAESIGSKLLVAGGFGFGVTASGTLVNRQGLAKLDVSGNVDAVFAPSPTTVSQLLADADGGATILGGSPTGTSLFQLDLTGKLSSAFAVFSSSDVPALSFARVMVRQGDGKLVIGGAAAQIGQTTSVPTGYFYAPALSRFFANGKPDTAFAPVFGAATAAEVPTVEDIQLDGDGALLVAGTFSSINGIPRSGVAALLAGGSVDPLKLSIASPDGFTTVLPHPGGYLLAASEFPFGGGFSTPSPFLGTIASGLAYDAFTVSDLVPVPPIGSSDQHYGVKFIAGYPGNGWVAMTYGLHDVVGDAPVTLVHLGADGLLDRSFATPAFTGPDSSASLSPPPQSADYVRCMIVLGDGSVVLGGTFWAANGEARSGLARLLPGR